MAVISPSTRKQVIRVLVISLLLDLISFTFILPLFPKLLEFYRDLELSNATTRKEANSTVLSYTLSTLNSYKNAFAKPINARYDIVLLGGALGSLFSLCQAIASPLIGRLSDKYGRRRALLCSMVGNIASVALWVCAVDFRTFLASRVVGGLSEGNVQLATAIATDVSNESERGATMALVGACFSVAFTVGPAMGAWLASKVIVEKNPFGVAAGVSLGLIVVETIYLWFSLPETLPSLVKQEEQGEKKSNGHANGNGHPKSVEKTSADKKNDSERTNPLWLLNMTHFLFILFFSGMEFSLPFMTYDLFQYSSKHTGRLLGYMGLIASVLQGGVVRRMHPLNVVQMGVISCAAAFYLLGTLNTVRGLYTAATLLAVTSGTVVTGLNSLSSFEAGKGERGSTLGNHRSWGQIGRALGPLIFCTLYWWAGRQTAYVVGGTGMVGVAGLVLGTLKKPAGTEMIGRKKKVETKTQ